MRLNEVEPGKQLGAVYWSVGLVCLCKLGIPRARVYRAYSPVGREIGASRAWGLMTGLSGFASHQCGLHLGAGCQ